MSNRLPDCPVAPNGAKPALSGAAAAEFDLMANRLHCIRGVTDAALSHLDLDALTDALLAHMSGALQADTALIWLLGDDDYLTVRACRGLDCAVEHWPRLRVGNGIIGRVAGERTAIAIDDVTKIEVGNLFLSQQLRALMAVPLLAHGRLIGVLQVGAGRPHQFDHEAMQLLELVAPPIAAAIERGQLFEQVRSSREQLHALSHRLLEIQESERRQVARELHDEIGQMLTFLKLHLQTAMQKDGAAMPDHLRSGIEIVDSTIEQVRNLSRDLRPPMLDDLGLVPTLRWYADRQHQFTGISLQVAADVMVERAQPEIEIACFRVAQEAVTNAVRHATAQGIEIELRLRDGQLLLWVRDDGVGFDVAGAQQRVTQGHSMGLLNMEERVRLAGGQFQISSKGGQGTQIRASFPLARVKGELLPRVTSTANPAAARSAR